MRSLAIVPARAGSKRIPGKNLCEVGGKSLVTRAVESASPCDVTIVSTDSDEIAAVATSLGARRHWRSAQHATDTAELEAVINQIVGDSDFEPEDFGGYDRANSRDAIVLLQPTSPFRTAEHVEHALSLLRRSEHGCVVSVTALHSLHPVFSGEVFDGNYYPRNTTAARRRSSTLSHLVYENGAVYAFTLAHWMRHGKRLGNAATALLMHWSEAVEIDSPEDLEAARRLAR